MSDFPKWLLALAGANLLPLLCAPLYLFTSNLLGESSQAFVRFLLYTATQLLWALPLAGFFLALDSWRRGYEKRAVILAVGGLIITVAGFCLLASA